MASVEYIVYTDITHVHCKQFTSATQVAYCAEGNDYYEDVALSLGVDAISLVSPIPQICKRLLLNYVTMRISEDSIGTNSSLGGDGDMYVDMRDTAQKTVAELQSQITPETLTGVYQNNRVGKSISFGKIWRSQ